MCPTTVHIVRHGEGYHQLPKENPNENIHDPYLTPYGLEQARLWSETFEHHAEVQLLAASPLRRALQTCIRAFQPEIQRGLKVVAVPGAMEARDTLSDTGSDVSVLAPEFGYVVDFQEVGEGWQYKEGENAVNLKALRERARKLRLWLRNRPETNIVVVMHGLFAHYMTGNIDDSGNQTGDWWHNLTCRTYTIEDSDDENASLVETQESKERVQIKFSDDA